MTAIANLSADTTSAHVIEAILQDGAAIVTGVLDDEQTTRIQEEMKPYLDRSAVGTDAFQGFQTTRTGALIARSPASRGVIIHPLALRVAEGFLGKYCDRIQLHLTQIIRLLPGQGEQELHRDRLVWGRHLPFDVEPQLNTLWALTDFTALNGATRVVPESQGWQAGRVPSTTEITQAVMPKGSVLFYTGTVLHGGGANGSDAARLGMNITYTLGWLRTEENQFLSCPIDTVRSLPEELQELMGYTMGNYALGYFSAPEPVEGLPDTLPPELALGRMPRHLAEVDPLS